MYVKVSTVALFLFGVTFLFTLLPGHTDELPEQEGIAVIELFTSQGCSSCPSADRLLSQLIDEAENESLPVYGLSFHVDYWNRLGWKDPYSEKAYTERQYAYARQMGKRGVYTPQMVVNGQAEFVGSDKRQATREVEIARKKTPSGALELKSLNLDDGQLTFQYHSEALNQGNWINIALVERGIATEVKRGENRGRLLEHDNVVRNFKQEAFKQNNRLSISIPDDLNLIKSSLILYTQDKSTFKIAAATRISLAQLLNDSKN